MRDESENESSELTRCWCGASGTFDELFDFKYVDKCCHGTGVLYCHCGGDMCVCHHHGEVDCFGCEDCLFDDDY